MPHVAARHLRHLGAQDFEGPHFRQNGALSPKWTHMPHSVLGPREHATTLELLLLRVLVAHPHLDGWFSGVLNGGNAHFQWEFGTPTPQW